MEQLMINKDNTLVSEASHFAALGEIAKSATQKDGLYALFNKIVDFISDAMEVETVSIMLPDTSDPDYLVIKACRGLPGNIMETARVRIGSRVSGYVFATGDPLLIEDIDYDTAKRFDIAHEEHYKTPTLLTVPIKGSEQILGVININNKKSGLPFHDNDFNLLSILSGYVALAIENADHYMKLMEKESEFEKLTERLKTTLEHQSQILMKLSYAIRSPLTGILGYTELLLNKTDSGISESDKSILKKILDKSWKLAELAQRIFEYESILVDDIKFEPKKVNLNQLVEGVADRLSVHAQDKKVEVKVTSKEKSEALIDPFFLSKAISEIVDNAIRHTKTGGTVEVKVKSDGPTAKIWVTDQGHGIIPEQVDKIFYPFYKGAADEEEELERLGLGLSIAKLIVEKLSGTIKVEKTGLSGSTLLVELPCWKSEAKSIH